LPLFSATAIDDFDKSYREGLFYRIIGTNAVHHNELLKKEWYIEADVTTLFAQIISLLHHNRSLSPMLDNRVIIAKKIKKTMTAQATHAHQPSLPL
jgi:ribose-phosphate pyrophosphokinase